MLSPRPQEASLSTELLDRLKALPPALFEELLFRLRPPPGLIPPAPADQTTRALALITWAEWEGGIGLERISEELGRVGRSSPRMGSQASGDTPPPAGQSPADPPESGQNSVSNTSPPGGQNPPSPGALGTYQWHAFVSHSSKDKPWVRMLVARLRADGFNIWMDEDNIEAGGAIQRSVEEGLAQSRDLILIMSKHSVGTDQGPGSGWVELETLIRTTFDPSSRVRRVLPLKIGPCKVPLSIRPFRYLEVENQAQLDAEYPRIVATLRREVVPPPPPPKPWWKWWGWMLGLVLAIGVAGARMLSGNDTLGGVMGQAAQPALKVGVELEGRRFVEGVGLVPGAVVDGATLPSGSQIRVRVTPSEPAYVAVYGIGTTGQFDTHYPHADVRDSGPSATRVAVPSDHGWLELSGPPGQETLLVVVSRTPLPPLGKDDGPSLASRARDFVRVGDPEDQRVAPPSDAETWLTRYQAEVGEGMAIHHLTFTHVAPGKSAESTEGVTHE